MLDISGGVVVGAHGHLFAEFPDFVQQGPVQLFMHGEARQVDVAHHPFFMGEVVGDLLNQAIQPFDQEQAIRTGMNMGKKRLDLADEIPMLLVNGIDVCTQAFFPQHQQHPMVFEILLN
nr:hypothetical protein [Magnetospirillum sulfuroxidans]